MLRTLLARDVYVQVYPNRFVLKRLEAGARPVTLEADEPFTTERLLVGQFSIAERLLRQGLKAVFPARWLSPGPVVVVHPMEKVEGGLSEVEDRLFRELAAGAGAWKVVVWTGHELSGAEVKARAADA